ncbi:MAG: DNA mismatch repair endonuclease MutL [Gemmataceae bacterium]
MPRIRQLPPSVITKIAAGEVIERPASVVKELLENSVDAGATRIDLELEQGGIELIRVTDDGHGIEADDLPLAFASHATSKLKDADDLFRIGTLGFRGEALASIGGIAQVNLQSRPAAQLHGAEISCHGDQLSAVRAWNGAPGTRLEVRHLFFNTPVRRKFLRTPGTELGHVDDVFTRLALAQPHLHLTFTHNGKRVYEVPARAGRRERIGLFFGQELPDLLFEVEQSQGPVKLQGYIADPACDRGNVRMQHLFLNGRWIRDRSLAHALQEGYRGLLMTGRYAVAFLFLDVPPDAVDVNVHPTKTEVRFRDGQALYHLVLSCVRDRLRRENLTARLQVPRHNDLPEGQARYASEYNPRAWSLQSPAPPGPRLPFEPLAPLAPHTPVTLLEEEPAVRERAPAEPVAHQDLPAAPSRETRHAPTAQEAAAAAVDAAPEATALPATNGSLKALQLYDSYVVLETPEGMLVIDQHALHERILFEQLQDRLRTGRLEKQKLLVPEPIDLPAEQAALALEHQSELAELGLDIEDFGGGTLLLTSYPAVLGKRTPAGILRDVVDHLVSKERPPERAQLLNALLSLMACKAAVKAGDRLTPHQIEALLEQRHLARDAHHCPHGRPTSLLFSKQDLDRQFRRI